MNIAYAVFLGLAFFAGVVFGQWKNEREARLRREKLENSAIMVSVPVGKLAASRTMELLADLLRRVEEEENGVEK